MSVPRIHERERSAILSSLAAGVVPRLGLQHIQVGRKAEISALLDDLKKIEAGAAAIRFIVGRFGAGKSFFLNLIQTVALERKFVVARADITTDRRLHSSKGQAQALFAELMKNLSTRGKPDGGALGNLVERWVGEVAHTVEQSGGGAAEVQISLQERCQPLQDLVSGHDFVKVLGEYYRGYREQNPQRLAAAIRWLRAEYPNKTEARAELGVRTIIDDDSMYDYLKLFAKFVTIAGYSGLIVSLDELVVLSHRLNNKIARNNNYEAILRILNDCLQGQVEGLGFLFAATDDCLEDKRRGLMSYPALERRLADNRFATEGRVDYAGPVLKLATLTPEDCVVLLHNIRRVHPYGTTLADEAIECYLQSCSQRMGAAYFQTPGQTVKDFIGLLNVLQQNPGADWRALIGDLKSVAPPTADPAEATPANEDNQDDDLVSLKL
jgi:hypothetical protein